MQRIMQRKKLMFKIPQPSSKIRKICYIIINNPWFDKLIFVIIIINIVLMGYDRLGLSKSVKLSITVLNICFLAIFNLEAIIKIIGIGFMFYFKEI